MKKRLLSMLLLVCMTVTMLSACGDDTETSSQYAPDSFVTENVVSYNYYQPLNIIDDNYRNYYEIFVYSFYDSNGDGIGDLQGVIEKLDYIEYMGFNGIWLMPIMPSTTYHKYDVVDYYGIDSQYGTMEDFEQLVDECHKRGINIIIDFVMNHTSAKHEWFKEAVSYLQGLEKDQEPDYTECPYAEYYNFSNVQESSTFYRISSNWYYEGEFWDQMPDLNFESDALKKEFEDIAKFWIEKGVDGFRMDAVMHIYEDNATKNNEVLDWFYTYCKSLNPDFYMVSEVWASSLTIRDYYESKTPSMFNFDFSQAEGYLADTVKGQMGAEAFVDAMIEWDAQMSSVYEDFIDAPFLSNHDNVRISNALANKENRMKMACGLLMMMNGSPFVYYGEEIGMTSAGDKDENKRIPMTWSNTDGTGITFGPSGWNTSLKSAFEAVDEQLKDGNSILNYYRMALRLRNENPEIARGEIKKIDSLCEGTQAVITKTYQDSTIAILYNTSSKETVIDIRGTEIEDMAMRGYLTINGEKVILKNGKVTMPGQSICILK